MSTLTGVGVGPGDPELLTLLGLRRLREADAIVVPVRDDRDEVGYAERVVRHHLPGAPIVRAPFALTDRSGVSARREQAWDAAAALVVEAFERGASSIAFATIGDPNVYSTFGYLATTVRTLRPGTSVTTVPGITAMQSLAAVGETVLCEGAEPLVLFPAAGSPDRLDALLGHPMLADASVVAYKGGRHWPAVREILTRRGRLADAVVGCHLGRDDETVQPAADVDAEIPYLSTVLAPPARMQRGGKL
ncbi:precorrin-2 C(20)-methyltransferase [uncultured Jatrophihabitans sp.]|uniref:precorrin-2 C(20)-methyltransferase n=1 Tax=uncultured Jatrophihabitans sp. TaxID=1610747 RepID=UPI0035CC4A20